MLSHPFIIPVLWKGAIESVVADMTICLAAFEAAAIKKSTQR
jgi:hypothetical protein